MRAPFLRGGAVGRVRRKIVLPVGVDGARRRSGARPAREVSGVLGRARAPARARHPDRVMYPLAVKWNAPAQAAVAAECACANAGPVKSIFLAGNGPPDCPLPPHKQQTSRLHQPPPPSAHSRTVSGGAPPQKAWRLRTAPKLLQPPNIGGGEEPLVSCHKRQRLGHTRGLRRGRPRPDATVCPLNTKFTNDGRNVPECLNLPNVVIGTLARVEETMLITYMLTTTAR